MSILFEYDNQNLLSFLKAFDNNKGLRNSFLKRTEVFSQEPFYDTIVHIIQLYLEIAGESTISNDKAKNLEIIKQEYFKISKLNFMSFEDLKLKKGSQTRLTSAIYAGSILALFTYRKQFDMKQNFSGHWKDNIKESKKRWEKVSVASKIKICNLLVSRLKAVLQDNRGSKGCSSLLKIAIHAIQMFNIHNESLQKDKNSKPKRPETVRIEFQFSFGVRSPHTYVYSLWEHPELWFLVDFPQLCTNENVLVRLTWLMIAFSLSLIALPVIYLFRGLAMCPLVVWFCCDHVRRILQDDESHSPTIRQFLVNWETRPPQETRKTKVKLNV